MREFMNTWISQFEEQYGVQIIGVKWSKWEDIWDIQVYGEKSFGSIPGEQFEVARSRRTVHLAVDFQGMRFIWVKDIEEEKNDND